MSNFTEKEFDNWFNFDALDKKVEECCRIATTSPEALYIFMQRYTHFNGYAGSLVARLASSIGLSRDLFRKQDCEVQDEADRGLEIAAKIFAATIDEHADKHHHLPHRTLAQATLRAVGEYANLSVAERNAFSRIPNYLDSILTATVNGYQGVPKDVKELITAMGFHAASEILADHEYALIDKVIRYENRGSGFAKYLKQTHCKVDLNSKKVSSWYWIATHGKHGGSGVEREHFEDALDALNLAVQYRSETKEQIKKWAFEGFNAFVQIQQNLFKEIQNECLRLSKAAA